MNQWRKMVWDARHRRTSPGESRDDAFQMIRWGIVSLTKASVCHKDLEAILGRRR
jgi:hypothetical protein